MRNPISRTYLINKLIKDNNLLSYLEIGVSNPIVNFLQVECARKVGVDPCIVCEYHTQEAIENFKPFVDFQTTSDEFFAQNRERFDLIFIDGDHSFEQSLKDLNNALKVVSKRGFIVMHDSMPASYEMTQLSNLQLQKPYTGEVWKTVLSAIHQSKGILDIRTFPWESGITVIKKVSDKDIEIRAERLDYKDDFDLLSFQQEYDIHALNNDKVSYFTPLYNTAEFFIELTARTVLYQTNPNWEWVVLDDSSNEHDAQRLCKYFESLNDSRIKYFRYNKQSGGFIGKAKWQAASHCSGKYIAELDHDDLLMPNLTEDILANSDGYDFIYTNCATMRFSNTLELVNTEPYPEGFAMGYGSYRTIQGLSPITGNTITYEEHVACPINPKTIRHIVSVPNHIRIWNREFYNRIGGHNPNLWVGDDYELIVRTFLAGGKFLHMDILGYIQIDNGTNTTDYRREIIQGIVNATALKYNEDIKKEFERRGMKDWAYDYHKRHFGFKKIQYVNVYTDKNAVGVESRVGSC